MCLPVEVAVRAQGVQRGAVIIGWVPRGRRAGLGRVSISGPGHYLPSGGKEKEAQKDPVNERQKNSRRVWGCWTWEVLQNQLQRPLTRSRRRLNSILKFRQKEIGEVVSYQWCLSRVSGHGPLSSQCVGWWTGEVWKREKMLSRDRRVGKR